MAQRLAAFAFIFAAVAAYFLYSGLTLETSVADGAGGSVANIQLMHVQAMNIGLGIGAAVIASVFTVGAALVSSRG